MLAIGRGFRRLLAEPVIQFLLIGTMLYLAFGRASSTDDGVIVISAVEQSRLATQFERNRQRAPSSDEWQDLINTHAAETAQVREALRLGLDQGDEIIRRRLLQKMRFVLEARSQPGSPSRDQLQAFFRKHTETYAHPARYTIEHRFFRSAEKARRSAADALRDLMEREQESRVGDHFDRGYRFVGRSLDELRDLFGPRFADRIAQREPDTAWSGPVQSRYGQHLVRVLEIEPARVPDYPDVADQVYRDWRQAEQERLIDAQVQQLIKAYEIQLAPLDDA